MIIVILQGGLGNQMFQYAAGRQLALLRETQLQLDTSWYERADQSDGVGKRVYELGPMAIEEHIYRPTFLSRLRLKMLGAGIYTDEAEPYIFHKEVLELPNYTRLFGFFQNGRYAEGIRDLLIKEFEFKAPPTGKNKTVLAEIRSNESSVSLHVRRGDYVTSAAHAAHHGAKGIDYYKQAVVAIKKTTPKPTLYIFSDDPAWCKQNLKLGVPTVYVDHGNTGDEDMRLMKACRHNIIANSSLSWWAAWLNPNPKKVVVAPQQWVNDPDTDASDVVPKNVAQGLTPPLVSVVMPAYNAAAYIAESIASVQAQTYPDWQLVIVDDGSTDGTKAVVTKLKLPKKQLLYIETANAGPGAARNRGIAAAKGELIAFLDADDLWDPTKLELQVALLQAGPYDLVFSSGRFFGATEAHRFVTARGPYSGPGMFRVLFQHNRIPILSVLTTKAALERGGGFKESGLLARKAEDYDLWLRMAAAGCSFFGMPEELVSYRLHAESSTNQTQVMLQAELAATRQFKTTYGAEEPERYQRRLRELYDRLAAAAAHDGDIAQATRYLGELSPSPVRAIKAVSLRLLGRRYSGAYHRWLRRLP